MLDNYDVVIIGTGLCARSVFEGIISNSEMTGNICFLQVNNAKTKHHTTVLKYGGMAKYWHKGLMSPGMKYLEDKGLSETLIKEFDDKYCPVIDHSEPVMHISPLNINSFIAPYDLVESIDSIEYIDYDNNIVNIKIKNKEGNSTISTKKLVVAASSIGCLDILSMITKKNIECEINDHIMGISKDDLNISTSPLWSEFSEGIKERRLSLMFPNGVYLSDRVDLLVVPFVGRILYGFHVPKLAFEAVMKKLFKPKLFYTFTLKTPMENLYKYCTGKITAKQKFVSAYHCIGEYPFDVKNTKFNENISFISGLNVGNDYKFFPSYLMGLIGYKLGKELALSLRKEGIE